MPRPRRTTLLVHASVVLATGLAGVLSAVTTTSPAARADEPGPTPSESPGSPSPSATPTTSTATRPPIYPVPSSRITRLPGCPPPPPVRRGGGRPVAPTPKVAEAKVPAPVALPTGRVADLDPIVGTGVWVTVFKGGSVDAGTIVGKAVSARMHSIWIRTGGTYGGGYAANVLKDLLPLAHAKGLKVIAWDFPTLSDPAADARRMVATMTYRSPSGDQVDGVSPDVETRSEGVFLTPRRVTSYLSRITAAADSRPVVLTAFRPTDHWWGTNGANGGYPYREAARYVDAFAPMVYWGCNEPGTVTQQAVDRLRTLKPVHVVGQAYDMHRDGAGRAGLPPGKEVWRFLDVADRRGAVGGSLYLFSQMRGEQWRAMWGYDGWR